MTPDFDTGGADEKRASHDDDDVVAEARERLLGGHDAGEHGGEQRQRRHHIVADAPPHEEPHHAGDDGEGERLLKGHEDPGAAGLAAWTDNAGRAGLIQRSGFPSPLEGEGGPCVSRGRERGP
jgi:hypothetical protein